MVSVEPGDQLAAVVERVAAAAADPRAVVELGRPAEPKGSARKGRALARNRRAAMCFHWQPLEVQVRIDGSVEPVSDRDADSYFGSRPRGSQIGAWASLQSRPIEPTGEPERRVAEYEQRFAGGVVPRPPHWSGFRLVPSAIEFWKNMPNRLHVRHLYVADGSGWKVNTLYP